MATLAARNTCCRLCAGIGIAVVLAASGCGAARRIAGRVPQGPVDAANVRAINRDIAVAAGRRSARSGDYRIGPEDLLEVTLFDIAGKDSEPRRVTARVSQSGSITLPLVSQVEVGGRTAVEAEEALRGHYRRYIHSPQLAVSVKEYRSYRVSVVGHVEKPGVFEITTERTLLEVLAMAGGLSDKAGRTVQISRHADQRLETLLVDLDRLSQDAEGLENVVMMPGDVVNVPKAGVVYVQGSVKKPGAYRLRDAMTVSQAISAAGGPDEKLASTGGIRLFRRGEQGDRNEVPIDIDAINSGRSEDLLLVENDIVVVPMSLPRYVIDRFIGGIGMGLSVPIF